MDDIDHIEIWKMKKLLKTLAKAKGNGTSMITLALPPDKSLPYVNSMLTNEYGTATNIKSRVNKLSVLSAITSTQQKLKQYKTIPKNGLVIYCGTILIDGNKEKKVTYDIEPFKPINQFMYLCDSRFHTEVIENILGAEDKYGFIIMDGNGVLYATLCGNDQDILHQFSVDLPKKHGRGGQSALRFSRLRVEARNNYIRKVGELATHYFISNDIPNVKGLILAGSAELKVELSESQHFDGRLKPKVISIIDIAYGGANGLNQAIELSAETLSNVKLVEEKKLLESYFHEITMDTGKFCFGIKNSMMAVEAGVSDTLIVWENLDLKMCVFIDSDGKEHVEYLNKDQDLNKLDPVTNMHMEIKSCEDWIDWIAENYKKMGTKLEFITDRSSEGTQFVKGFGGVGCILRWNMEFPDEFIDFDNEEYNDNNDSDENNSEIDLDDFF
ncbi:eRF1 domain 2 [seawater metagenome]|uniref:ERF1 domain 2 n=1 Tax=seawater metagenome TaxID=1561972 RepID=A0A5E8CMG4_9ZZZZ